MFVNTTTDFVVVVQLGHHRQSYVLSTGTYLVMPIVEDAILPAREVQLEQFIHPMLTLANALY